MPKRQIAIGIAIAVVIILLDQWTKHLASDKLVYNQPLELLPVFDLTLRHNTGAAFSMFADAGGWQRWMLGGISAAVSIMLVVWMYRLRADERLLLASLSAILGGALGNLWDRIELGYVVDFISVHYQSYYFPAFNIADSAITIGAGLMILDMIIHREKHRANQGEGHRDPE